MGGVALLIIGVFAPLFGGLARAEHVQKCERNSYMLADGLNVICSASWLFAGRCNGQDMWNSWTVTGRTTPPGPFVTPWLDVPIIVVGYELLKFQPSPLLHPSSLLHPIRLWANWTTSSFMVGSTITPDIMVALGPGETHVKQMWPTGSGQPWPRVQDARPVQPLRDNDGTIRSATGDLLDLHGACFGGGDITIHLTIYYTPRDESPAVDVPSHSR
jgi:hypothetical protein